jgi:hypothetical protein
MRISSLAIIGLAVFLAGITLASAEESMECRSTTARNTTQIHRSS